MIPLIYNVQKGDEWLLGEGKGGKGVRVSFAYCNDLIKPTILPSFKRKKPLVTPGLPK